MIETVIKKKTWVHLFCNPAPNILLAWTAGLATSEASPGDGWAGRGTGGDVTRTGAGSLGTDGAAAPRRLGGAGVAVFATPGTQKRVVHPTAGVNRELVNSTWSLAVHHHTDNRCWVLTGTKQATCWLSARPTNPCLKRIRGWNNWSLTCQVGQFLDVSFLSVRQRAH